MSKKILVVEDSPTQAQRAQLILQHNGYNVAWAENGAKGLSAVATDKPDLVVTDIVMPEMDGYEMTRRLKAATDTREIPVVMLTSQDQIMDIIRGLGVGADNFITKPYESGTLVESIENIFSNLELRRQGRLEDDIMMEQFKDRIVMTRDKHQILELLLGTVGVTIHCSVLGLFLLSQGTSHPLYMASVQPLSQPATRDLLGKLLDAVNVLGDWGLTPDDLSTTFVVKEKGLPELEAQFHSFISVPLISQGDLIGIMITANTVPDAFQPDDVKLLYTIGMESAEAFNRISR